MRPKVIVLLNALLISFKISVLCAQPEPAEKRNPTPEEIINAFSAKESDFFDAWKQYVYRQITEVRILSVNGYKTNENMRLVYDVVFNDDGSREVRLMQKSGELRSVLWTREDAEMITNLTPFALTARDLPLYELKYEGKQKIDELDCYVFSVKPRSTKGSRLYFQGKIWVDDQDLQIVRTVGKPVPQRGSSRFPEFETVRQVIDNDYWFPVWTHADSVLNFDQQKVRIEETINYQGYRKFRTKATIEFPQPKP